MNSLKEAGVIMLSSRLHFLLISCLVSSGCVLSIGATQNQSSSVVFSGVSESARLMLNNGEYNTVLIDSPAGELATDLSTSDNIEINADVQSDSLLKIAEFSKNISRSSQNTNVGKILTIGLSNNGLYSCNRRLLGNVLMIEGVCITRIQVKLPRNSRTKVIVNGALAILPPPPPPPSLADLAEGLKRIGADDNSRFELLQSFVNAHSPGERFVTIQDLMDIAETFSFDDKRLDALRLFRGRVMDRENAWRVAETFDSDFDNRKVQAIVALSE